MLIGLEGGAHGQRAPRTIGQALEAYAQDRLASLQSGDEVGIQVALEVMAAFFRDDHAEIVGGRRARRGGRERTWDLPARCLVRGLHASAHLFSYSCVVSVGVIGRFAAEVRALASWSAVHGLSDTTSLAQFRRGFRQALASMREHQRLQAALEQAHAPFIVAEGGPMLEGRFLVEHVDALGLRVGIPDEGKHHRVRLPTAATRFFQPGQAVSMAMFERALGWTPVAASLPAHPHWLERRFTELEELPWQHPARDTGSGVEGELSGGTDPGSAGSPPDGTSGADLPTARPSPRG